MSWQSIIVIVIIAAAVVYGAYRFYKTMKHGGCGCSPATGEEGGQCGGCAGCKTTVKDCCRPK